MWFMMKMHKSLHNNIVPTFAKVKGQFIESKDQIKSEEGVLKSHLLNHKKNFQYLLNYHKHFWNTMFQQVGSTKALKETSHLHYRLIIYSNSSVKQEAA